MEKAVGQELVKDKPQEMSEGSPSTSETKATEPVMISESFLDSTQKVSGDMSAVRNSHELDSELLEETLEEKHEQATVSLAATKKDKGEASPLSEFLIEGSEVKTCLDNRSTGCSLSVETTLSPASVQLAMSNPEADLVVPTGNDIVLTVITEENKITKEETLIFTPASELKEHGSVAELTKVETILVNSAECCKEDENGSLEKNTQAENLRVNYSEGNTENSSSEEEMEISKDSCMSANLTAEKLVDTYTQLVQEEAGGPHVEIRSFSKTTSSGFLKENTQGMVEDSPSTFVTKTTETIMMSENVSVDISPVGGNTQELNHELTDEEREEKQELNIVPVAETEKEKTKAPSPSEFLIEWTEVSIPESEQFVETTPPPPSVQIAVNNRESDLSVPTGHILVKDIVSPVIAEKDSKTEEGPKSVNSFVAKLAETDVLETSPECWNESLSSKDDDRGSLENGKKSAKRHGNFSEYNAENSSAEEQADICEVGRISDGHCVDRETLDEVKDESLMKNVQTISSERGCKPNALELSGSFSTDFASHSQKEENVSECLEGEEMKALSQPTPINKAARNILDMSSLFTTPERNLMLMEKLSESGKIRAADIVTQHNDEAVESHYVVFTTPEQVLLLGDSGLDDSGKEEEHTATDFPDESNISTDVERHLLSEESGLHKTTKTKYNTEATCEESSVFISPERRQPLGNSEPHTAGKQERKEVEFKDESAFFTTLETRLLLGESGQNRLANGSPISAQYQSHCASSPKVILKDDSVVLESQVAAPDFRESTIAAFSGSIASKVSYSHGFSTGEETAGAEFMPKASQAETDAGPDAIQSTSNQSRGNSLHVDSGNHFDFVTKAKDTIMDAYVFALPGEGNSQTTGEISNHTEVAGTCSLLSEESTPSTYIQNQIRDAVEELAVTDEPIDAKLTKYTQSDSKTFDLPVEGDSKSIGEFFCQYEVTGTCFMVSEKSSPSMDIQNHICDAVEEELAARDENKADELTEAKVTKKVESSGGSDVSGKASVVAGTEEEHLSYNSEVTDPVDTAFEKNISLAPDESTLEENKNAEAVDDEMVNGEATPGPEETLVKPSDNNGESGTLSEKQVRREPVLIYSTQVKPKWHDMKENAPNSKIVDNLNVTAPRTSKRQPLQDLRKN
ncbi:hypothetical protein HA466_0090090 [Hirschfeldia incana]|nr:hypothetical protein HA466_0090090 [Hirschfeldia incana]